MFPVQPELRISETTYIADKFDSIMSLAKAREAQPDLINSLITYAYGSDEKYKSTNFPMLFYTQGQGRKRPVKSLDGSFEAYMYGKPKKTSRIARAITQTKPGVGGTIFKAVFEDRWFKKGQTIYAGMLGKVQARIVTDPQKDPKGYIYTLQLFTTSNTFFCPPEYLVKGATWSGGVVKASLLRSKGTEQRAQTWFRVKNQLSLIRESYNWAGNIANKALKMGVKIDGKTYTFWTEYEKYLCDLAFQEKKEADFIFSQYNVNSDGMIQVIDEDSDEVVPSSMGIWNQISQTLEYGQLTENRMNGFIQDIVYNGGAQVTGNKERVIIGGTGLMMEIDRAMKNALNVFTPIQSDFYARQSGDGLQFGGYFTSYKHISGVIFRFVQHNSFDHGAIAESCPRHPKNTNMSLMSYCGMALDFAMVDVDKKVTGKEQESNIMFLYEEGREYDEWVVEGGSKIPNRTMSASRATDQDQSSWHMLATQGGHINYPGMCAKIICKLS